jgi:nitrate/nitrite transporter NarK
LAWDLSLKTVLRYPRILLGGFLSLATLSVMNSAYSNVLLSIKTDYALTYTQSGALMSAYFVGYTIGQIPWGLAADRYGSRRVMALSVLGVSLSTSLFGLAPNYLTILVTRFLAGLLGAGVFVPGVRLVSSWFNSEERGSALGAINIGGSTGMILASWAVPFVAISLGWKSSLSFTGLIGVLSAVSIWFLLKDRQSESQDKADFSMIPFKDQRFWSLALLQFIRLGAFYTFIGWLPLVLKEEYGLSVVAVSTAMSLFNLAGMAANPLGGVFSDKLGEKNVLLICFTFLSLGTLGFTLKFNGVIVMFMVFIAGWFINFVRSPSFAIIPRLFGTETAGSVSGIQNTFASFGALVLPLALGFIRDTTSSYQAGWYAISALMLIVSIGLLTIRSMDSP